MGSIIGTVYLESKSKKDIALAIAEIREDIRHNADLEEFPNMGDYIHQIKDVCPNKIFDSEEDAIKYCNTLNWNRNYNCLVAYKDLLKAKETKKIINLEERLNKEQLKLDTYIKEHSINSFKSKLISCPNCESKINKNYIYRDKCPLCRTDLRSETTKNTIERYEKKH